MKSFFFCRKFESANFQINKFLSVFPFLVLVLLSGCEENTEKPALESIELTINGKEVAISDSLVFVQKNDSLNLIQISPSPADAYLYYSVNNGNFELNNNGIVKLNKGDSLLQFYHVKEGFKNSQIRTILFSGNAKRFLNPLQIYPNPTDSIIYLTAENRSRGQMEFLFLDMQGKNILNDSYFKNSDSISASFNVQDLQDGIYIIKIQYGVSSRGFRLVKNRN